MTEAQAVTVAENLAIVGYQLTPAEAQTLLDYLAAKPYAEVFMLIGMLTAHPVHEGA